MGKHFEKGKKVYGKQENADGFEEYDDAVVSDKDDVLSYGSEEEALKEEDESKKARRDGKGMQDRDDSRNKL